MRAIKVSNKTFLIRHWWRWYRVQRSGTDWQRLKVKPRERTIKEIQTNLKRAGY